MSTPQYIALLTMAVLIAGGILVAVGLVFGLGGIVALLLIAVAYVLGLVHGKDIP